MGRVRAAELDAVTLDAYGTLLTLVDPLPHLEALLPDHAPRAIAHAFRAEAAFYSERAGEGRDAATLTRLREECVAVFNDALDSSLSPDTYLSALRFEALPGTAEALDRLRALGLTLAVAANWDFSLHQRLDELGLAGFFASIIHAARKPAPDGILRALREIGVEPSRALHVGDDAADEQAARAAGVLFAPAPLPSAVAGLT